MPGQVRLRHDPARGSEHRCRGWFPPRRPRPVPASVDSQRSCGAIAPGQKEDPVEVRVHATHMTLSDSIRDLAEEKIGHATRVFDDTERIDVEFSEEHNPRIAEGRYRVEVTSMVAGQVVRVEAVGVDERAGLRPPPAKYQSRARRPQER